jgi:hypothetical protein
MPEYEAIGGIGESMKLNLKMKRIIRREKEKKREECREREREREKIRSRKGIIENNLFISSDCIYIYVQYSILKCLIIIIIIIIKSSAVKLCSS